ncbi:MAG: tetratricopeptide repeat protein [Gemmatimonadales bacterium]|jgi:uncharacterized membrane protein|nr:tetratricopeptide repeat protein [Gemmatimonadota bacterium]MBK7786042.1 tetratricopeptide repeat protein [Gemmatimonadota bacterium]MBP6667828.1 tetratricopeptide repeat protein [Gemmatimonadales bacterium]
MPDIGLLHPQIVHFVVALGIVGVLFRLVSLSGALAWTKPAATVLLLVAAVAALAAAKSGEEAHGPAERIPGAREAVHEHEEAGEWARNVFLLIGLLEVAGVALRQKPAGKWLLVASGVAGLAGIGALYRAGEAGGELVYSYAGGVGTRSGEAADVQRLLTAGLYHQAAAAREAGRPEEAARLTEELARQHPEDAGIRLLVIESQFQDRKDFAGALAALDQVPVPAEDPRLAVRLGLMRSDIYVAAGHPDSARATLTALAQQFPDSRWIKDALDRIK